MSVSHQLITFNIALEPAPVPTASIGTLALLVPNVTNLTSGSGRYQVFNTLKDVLDAGLTGTGATAAEAAATVAFSSPRKPTLILVNVDVTVGSETHAEAYNDFLNYGVGHFNVATVSRTAADQISLASVVNTLTGSNGMGVVGYYQTDDDSSGGWPVALAALEDTLNSALIYHDDDTEYHDVALPAARATFNWDVTAPTFTGRLYGVTGADVTQSELTAITGNNVNVTAPYAGQSAYLSPGLNAEGRPIEEVLTVYLFVARLKERLERTRARYDALGKKIPISTTGQAIVENDIRATFSILQAAGHFETRQEDPITGETFEPIEIIFPSDLSDDLANLRISVTVNLQQTRGARKFELDLNFTTSRLGA